MTDEDSGRRVPTPLDRPPPEVFHVVTDPKQAQLLSSYESLKFFRPFVAKELSVTDAAAEVGVNLDTMLYRVKTFLRAGLLQVSRLEKRAGRPIKYYRSVYDAYTIPFEMTPHATLEEALHLYFRECAAHIVPNMARTMRQLGREGRHLYRSLADGDVWQSSTGEQPVSSLRTAESFYVLDRFQGPVVDFMDDTLELTDDEARDLLIELYGVWRRYKDRGVGEEERKSRFFQFVVVPLS